MDSLVANLTLDSEAERNSTGTSLELLLIAIHYVVALAIIVCVIFARVLQGRGGYDDDNDPEEGNELSAASFASLASTPAPLKATSWRSI